MVSRTVRCSPAASGASRRARSRVVVPKATTPFSSWRVIPTSGSATSRLTEIAAQMVIGSSWATASTRAPLASSTQTESIVAPSWTRAGAASSAPAASGEKFSSR